MLRRIVLGVYALLLGAMFGVVWSAQVLGFLGLYTLPAALLLTIIVSAFAIAAYRRVGHEWFAEMATIAAPHPWNVLNASLLLAALGLLLVVFLFRMVAWPYSELGFSVPPDFFDYHAVRVIDLGYSGTMWNLSIPYGQYSNGYESILSFFYLFSSSVQSAGLVQAWIVVLLVLTVALLLLRYARFPLELGLASAVGMLFLPMLYGQVLLVGKNDVMLSTMVLIFILHAPVGAGKRGPHILGMAYATMIAIATKATGVTLLAPLWVLLLWRWWNAYRAGKAVPFLHPLVFVLSLLLMFPGGLWVIRNYLMMGRLVSPEIESFSVTTIAANLGNPLLYTSGDESMWLLLGAAAALVVFLLVLFTRRIGWELALVWAAMVAAFAITPLGAFHTPLSTTLHVEWRYALHLPMLGAVFLLAVIAPLLLRLYEATLQRRTLRYLASGFVLLGAVWGLILLEPANLFSLSAQRARILTEQHPPRPDAPYDSIIEYAQSEITEGTVYVANIPWYYLLITSPGLTLQQTVSFPLGLPPLEEPSAPDYAVLHRRAVNHGVVPPQGYEWELIYEDDTGQVYRRLP